jgi:hypothetical protein
LGLLNDVVRNTFTRRCWHSTCTEEGVQDSGAQIFDKPSLVHFFCFIDSSLCLQAHCNEGIVWSQLSMQMISHQVDKHTQSQFRECLFIIITYYSPHFQEQYSLCIIKACFDPGPAEFI